jgi:hypothetical protein
MMNGKTIAEWGMFPSKIGVVGSRRRNKLSDFKKVYRKLDDIYRAGSGDIIVSGLCRKGADYFALLIVRGYDLPHMWFPVDERKVDAAKGIDRKWAYARAAYDRNTDIARNSDILIACVAADRKGGTEDTIRKFLRFQKMKEKQAIALGRLILL